jgi:hypothetical protein
MLRNLGILKIVLFHQYIAGPLEVSRTAKATITIGKNNANTPSAPTITSKSFFNDIVDL